MRAFALVLLLFLTGMAGARAEDAPGPADKAAIQALIGRQIDAFRHDDAQGAWEAASPNIQRIFGTPAGFLAMVRSGYPSVYRPRAVEFRELRLESGLVRQDVLLVGPDQKAVIATYTMERQTDGTWRINGVHLSEAPEIAV